MLKPSLLRRCELACLSRFGMSSEIISICRALLMSNSFTIVVPLYHYMFTASSLQHLSQSWIDTRQGVC
jgi:hypothetical protein